MATPLSLAQASSAWTAESAFDACRYFLQLTASGRSDATVIEDLALFKARTELVHQYNQGTAHSNFKDSLRATLDHSHETIRVFYKDSLSPDSPILQAAQARVVLSHGMGTYVSDHRSMREIIVMLTDPSPGKSGGTLRYLKNSKTGTESTYVPLVAETFDSPGHGVGPALRKFKTLDQTIAYYSSYLKMVKAESPDLPLIVIARSASPRFFSEVNARHPGLIDALVFYGVEAPGSAELVELQKANNLAVYEKIGIQPNLKAMDWYQTLGIGIKWTPEHFGKTPTLIMTGTIDPDVLPRERHFFAELASKNPNIKYLEIEGGDHDVFDTQRHFKPVGRQAFVHFYEFVQGVLKKKSIK